MNLIIDGYNLLNAVSILPRGVGPGTLENARSALLNFLAETLKADQLGQTTVVFDAGADAPKGLPRLVDHQGITVRFASHYDDADALIEELILADTAPRNLTVVSSDHRLQRAAKRRRARAVDSDVWYAEVLRERQAGKPSAVEAAKPRPPATDEEVNYWLERFQQGPGNEGADESTTGPFPPGYCDDLTEDED